MKIVISKKQLLNVLTDVEKCVSKTEIIPITGSVVVSAEKDLVSFITTDTEKGIKAVVKTNVKEEGTIAIPFKKFIGLAKELSSDSDITISSSGLKATIVSGKSKFNISLFNPEEFPSMDFECNNGDKILIKEKDLKKIGQYITLTTSNDPVAPILQGLCLNTNSEGIVKSWSTDRNRLSEYKCSYEGESGFKKGIIVPSETIMSINSILRESDDNVCVMTNYSSVFFKTDDKTICSRLITGDYPDFSKKIPSNSHVLSFNRNELLGAIKQVMPFVTKDIFGVVLDIGSDNKAKIMFQNQSGDAEVVVDVTQVGGEQFKCRINCDYILSFLRVVKGENVVIEVSDEKGGLVCKSDDEEGYLSILMPMRI